MEKENTNILVVVNTMDSGRRARETDKEKCII